MIMGYRVVCLKLFYVKNYHTKYFEHEMFAIHGMRLCFTYLYLILIKLFPALLS